jgi:clan AA aspartic protease (TIGR02281 family)
MKKKIKNSLLAICVLSLESLTATQVYAQEAACEYQVLSSLPVSFRDGNSLPVIEGEINQKPATLLLDTGSSLTYIMPEAAEKLNLRVGKPSSIANGVGGATSRSVTKLSSLAIGNIRVDKPYLFVLNGMGFKPYFDAIAGADYLLQSDLEVNLQRKEIKFYRAKNCAAYPVPEWAMTAIPFLPVDKDDDRPSFIITINGEKFVAIVDTAAERSALSTVAAKRIGIDPSSGRLTQGDSVVGAGTGKAKNWRTTLDEVKIGDLILKNQEITVNQLPVSDNQIIEILLGKDFLMHHRVLFSMGSRQLYIATYPAK